MSKSQSATQLHNLRQQGGKNIQIGRPQTIPSTSFAKSLTSLDEFKYGFPSNGLSTVSNKWWGSSWHEGYEDACGKGTSNEVTKQQSSNVVDNGTGSVALYKEQHEDDEGRNADLQGTDLLRAVRKRIAEEGQDALKLGVTRNSGVNKIGRKEKALLLRIFKSSMPEQLIHGTS